MRYIVNPDRTEEDHKFTESDEALGYPGTPLNQDWMNSIQDEIINVCTVRGLSIDELNDQQMLEAMKPMVFNVDNTAGRLGLANQVPKAIRGDEAIQADTGDWYILQGENPGNNTDWVKRQAGSKIRTFYDYNYISIPSYGGVATIQVPSTKGLYVLGSVSCNGPGFVTVASLQYEQLYSHGGKIYGPRILITAFVDAEGTFTYPFMLPLLEGCEQLRFHSRTGNDVPLNITLWHWAEVL